MGKPYKILTLDLARDSRPTGAHYWIILEARNYTETRISYKTLSKRLGISRKRISRILSDLEKWGYIEKGDRRKGNTIIRAIITPDLVDIDDDANPLSGDNPSDANPLSGDHNPLSGDNMRGDAGPILEYQIHKQAGGTGPSCPEKSAVGAGAPPVKKIKKAETRTSQRAKQQAIIENQEIQKSTKINRQEELAIVTSASLNNPGEYNKSDKACAPKNNEKDMDQNKLKELWNKNKSDKACAPKNKKETGAKRLNKTQPDRDGVCLAPNQRHSAMGAKRPIATQDAAEATGRPTGGMPQPTPTQHNEGAVGDLPQEHNDYLKRCREEGEKRRKAAEDFDKVFGDCK